MAEIKPFFQKLEGNIYNAARYREGLDRLRRLYGDNGYIDANIITDEQIDYENNRVSLAVKIEENNRIRVRNVEVVRKEREAELEWKFLDRLMNKISPPVKDEVLKKEIRIQPGDVYRTFEELMIARQCAHCVGTEV